MVKSFSALMIVACVVAQGPPPRRGETREQQHSQTHTSSPPTGSNQQGTEDSSFFVKEIPAPKTQQEATQEAKDRAEKSANDRKLVEFTKWLVIATLILAAVGLLQ